jgi:Tfp pilus assembly protein PilN
MTVRINLLPKGYQPPKPAGPKELVIAVGAALAVLATGAFYSSVYAGTLDLERQLVAHQAKHEAVKAQLAEAAEIKAREVRVVQAENELRVLFGRRWSGVLSVLSTLTPKQVTWTSMKSQGDTVTLQGTSSDLADLAQLLGGLVTEKTVDRVSLKSVTEQGVPVAVTVQANESTPPAPQVSEDQKPTAPKESAQPKSKKDPKQESEEAVRAAVDSFLKAVRGDQEPRQMQFEMTIILVPAEGRDAQHGA